MATERSLSITHGETFSLVVRSRETEYFRGNIAALSSTNKKGAFDILPEHAHFISLIKKGITIHKTDGSTQEITFSNAVLKVKDNTAEVYIGIDI